MSSPAQVAPLRPGSENDGRHSDEGKSQKIVRCEKSIEGLLSTLLTCLGRFGGGSISRMSGFPRCAARAPSGRANTGKSPRHAPGIKLCLPWGGEVEFTVRCVFSFMRIRLTETVEADEAARRGRQANWTAEYIHPATACCVPVADPPVPTVHLGGGPSSWFPSAMPTASTTPRNRAVQDITITPIPVHSGLQFTRGLTYYVVGYSYPVAVGSAVDLSLAAVVCLSCPSGGVLSGDPDRRVGRPRLTQRLIRAASILLSLRWPRRSAFAFHSIQAAHREISSRPSLQEVFGRRHCFRRLSK